MADCAHGFSAPNNIIKTWPECQAGEGRHKCAVCAYEQGKLAAQGKVFPGSIERCDQGHDSAPLAMLKALPDSQAGPHRHRCAYKAFQDGKTAGALLAVQNNTDAADDAEQAIILARTDIGTTQKEQLILARRGQGAFRDNVRKVCSACRVTGVSDVRFLIASHIKPWRTSTDVERLDGYNGLLLAPHVDHFFDKGWITFEMNGDLVTSPHLPKGVWNAWGLNASANKPQFQKPHEPYLVYHRKNVFRA